MSRAAPRGRCWSPSEPFDFLLNLKLDPVQSEISLETDCCTSLSQSLSRALKFFILLVSQCLCQELLPVRGHDFFP